MRSLTAIILLVLFLASTSLIYVFRKAAKDTIEFEIAKTMLQIGVVAVAGAIVSVLIFEYQREQQAIDKQAELKRQANSAILEAQTKLFNDVSETIITFETLLLDITWLKITAPLDSPLSNQGFIKYTERVADLVAKWRSAAARAQTLASSNVSTKINKFLIKVFEEQDTPINELYHTKASKDQWSAQHQKNIKMLEEANKIIAELADDLNLAKEALVR